MSPNPHRDRADIVAGAAVAAGGLLAGVASRLPSLAFEFSELEGWVVLAAGGALVVGGLVMLTAEAARTRGFLAAGCLVVALIPVGLSVNILLGLLDAPRELPPAILALGGSVLAAAASAVVVSRRARVRHRPGPTLLLAGGGGVLAVAGTLLPWLYIRGPISGFSYTVGKVTFGLSLVAAAGGVVMGIHRSDRGRTALALTAASAAAVATVLATHGGVLLRFGVGFGVYLVVVGGLVALAFILAELLRSLGLPDPAPAPWVARTFLAFGTLGLTVSFLFQDRLEAADGSTFSMRLAATFLLLTGVGLAARQAWAWLLGFPVALAGIANGALLLFTEETRWLGYLLLLVYGNALEALRRGGNLAPVPPVAGDRPSV